MEIVGNQLKVRGGASIDYESSQLLRLNVRVTDNGNLPLSFTKPLTVSVLNVNEPTYSIIAASSSVNEGQPLAFAVAISGVTIGTPFYWAFDGSGIDQSDLSGSGLSGYGTTDANGQFMFTTGLANDYKIEGTEYLNAWLFTDPSRLTQVANTGYIAIADTSRQRPEPPRAPVFKLPSVRFSFVPGQYYQLTDIRDFGGTRHGGAPASVESQYLYHGGLDVNGDGSPEAIFTNQASRRWVTANVDPLTGQMDYGDHGQGGITRVVGIYVDPNVAEGEANGGRLKNGEIAPVRFGPFDSQNRFQNDLMIGNLTPITSGDFDNDSIYEVYWKTNDGTAFLRALMHPDGNIMYSNYQSPEQMSQYLSGQGFGATVQA